MIHVYLSVETPCWLYLKSVRKELGNTITCVVFREGFAYNVSLLTQLVILTKHHTALLVGGLKQNLVRGLCILLAAWNIILDQIAGSESSKSPATVPHRIKMAMGQNPSALFSDQNSWFMDVHPPKIWAQHRFWPIHVFTPLDSNHFLGDTFGIK